ARNFASAKSQLSSYANRFLFDSRGDKVRYHVVYLLSLLAEDLILNQTLDFVSNITAGPFVVNRLPFSVPMFRYNSTQIVTTEGYSSHSAQAQTIHPQH